MPLSDVSNPDRLPERIPILPIRSTIVFPSGATALQIGYGPNVEALTASPDGDLIVAMVATADDHFKLQPRPWKRSASRCASWTG
jgi:ATP-dependent Lon protease